jgi:predicted heme/steroid binding protein/uncharacterized membrane protein
MKKIDSEELSKCNGKDGSPVYIAHRGKVYDVSESKLWKTGLHMKRHAAGKDLTTDIQAAPHGPEVLERYSQVGVLEKVAALERNIPKSLSRLHSRFPMLRRHPHPMTVHFPIVFMFSTTMFNILYFFTGARSFELTALNCLGAGILFTPLVMGTGYYTWWVNYMARPLRPVSIKKKVSSILLAVEIAAFIWRMQVPGILDSFSVSSVIYSLLVLSLLPLVTVIGWFGAKLTFPIERD